MWVVRPFVAALLILAGCAHGPAAREAAERKAAIQAHAEAAARWAQKRVWLSALHELDLALALEPDNTKLLLARAWVSRREGSSPTSVKRALDRVIQTRA